MKTLKWKSGKYTGETQGQIPHGKGKFESSYDDKEGWIKFEGTFDRGNPVKGKLESNRWAMFNWIDFTYWKFLKDYDEEKHKKIALDEGKFSSIIFDGYFKEPRENLVNISHGVNRRYAGLEEIGWYDFDYAITLKDKFGAIYSGPLKKDQPWRPDGEGTLKFPDGIIMKGNFIPRGVTTGSKGIFEGKITYPDGKTKETEDDRNILDQFTDWFYD